MFLSGHAGKILNQIGEIRSRIEAFSPLRINDPDASDAAVAVILVESSPSNPELLLIKRATHDADPWSGHMAFPGGRRETEDNTLIETVCRETYEETGVRLSEREKIGRLNDIRPRGPGLPAVVVSPFVFLLPKFPAIRANDEVERSLWVSLDGLRNSVSRSTVYERGEALRVRSYLVGGQVVWGLTERILMSLLGLTE